MALQKISTNIIEDNAVDGTKISVGSPAAGDILYYDGSKYVELPKGTDGQELIVGTNNLPAWGQGTSGTSPTDGNAWILGGVNAGAGTGDLLYYSFNSDGHQVVATVTSWGGNSISSPPGIFGTIGVSSSTHSWHMGTHISTTITDITEKFAFASATDAANPTTLSHTGDCAGRFFSSSHIGCQSSTAGYCAGGRDFEGVARIASSRKVDFSNDNVSTLPGAANMPTTRFGHKCTNNSTHALYAGGRTSDSNNNNQSNLTRIDRFTFATETMQGSWDDLSTAMEGGSQSANETHSFFYGGQAAVTGGNPFATTIERFTFASQSSQTDHGSLTRQISNDEGAQNTTHGFSVGGADPNGVSFADVNAYAFANNTTAAKTADLQLTVNGGAGCQPPTV